MSGNGSNFCNSTTFTGIGWYSVPTGNYFVEYLGNSQNVSHTFQTNTAIMYGGGCSACPAPTPSVTVTPSITPTPSVTVTPSPTPSPTPCPPADATLSWTFSEMGGADAQMYIYINSQIEISSSTTSSGTYTIYEGDTIYVEIELNAACSGNDNEGNLYTQSNRGTLVYGACFTSTTGTYTSPTYTVVGGDLGSTITLDAYAQCYSICL